MAYCLAGILMDVEKKRMLKAYAVGIGIFILVVVACGLDLVGIVALL
jgi:hypothetical protein